MKAWYFAPALNHYMCIKDVIDTGAVRLTDTFKFLHHTLPMPTVLDTDRIIKATQQLRLAIEGKQNTPVDKFGAIQHLQALITGASNIPTVEEPEAVPEPEQKTPEPGLVHECEPKPIPLHLAVQSTPIPTDNTAQRPITFHLMTMNMTNQPLHKGDTI